MRLVSFTTTGVVAVLCLGFWAGTARSGDGEVVDYRLTEWKTQHFHDAKEANAHGSTLKKLGCEVRQETHGGHIDVRYRCAGWRRMSLKSHADAHRWESWLKSVGFETRHKH